MIKALLHKRGRSKSIFLDFQFPISFSTSESPSSDLFAQMSIYSDYLSRLVENIVERLFTFLESDEKLANFCYSASGEMFSLQSKTKENSLIEQPLWVCIAEVCVWAALK